MEMIKKLYAKAINALLGEQAKQPPIYIFDLDGTLSDAEHRRHLVNGESPNWLAFFRASVRDKPMGHVMIALRAALEYGCEVRIWSGRSAEVYDSTVHWLAQNLALPRADIERMLKMRDEGDTTPDDVLKHRWLHELHPADLMRVQAVYDDRQKVVDMWRKAGIPCFQVAPGEF